MTIRKTGAVTGRVLGVENAGQAPDSRTLPERLDEDGTLVDRPLQHREWPGEADPSADEADG